jgi:hypothetical protein
VPVAGAIDSKSASANAHVPVSQRARLLTVGWLTGRRGHIKSGLRAHSYPLTCLWICTLF